MNLQMFMTAYNTFCDVVTPDMISDLIIDPKRLTIYELAILVLFRKAQTLGEAPDVSDFQAALDTINNLN